MDLPPDSLVNRQNWPDWAMESVGDLVGLVALQSLSQSEKQLYFLGSPFLEDAETIKPRVSYYTGEGGRYAVEGPAKITVASTPEAACMRAIINRLAMSHIPNIDENCWSGWYPYRGGMKLISTAEMVRIAQHDPALRFVAAIDISRISPQDVRQSMHGYNFTADLKGPSTISLRSELIVPVTGRQDLPEMLLIDEDPVTRAEAKSIFDWLWHTNGDNVIPSVVTLSTVGGRRNFRIKKLGQVSLSQA
jgi:hypothetical protein